MVFAHHFAGDLGALARRAIGRETHLRHAEEDAAMDRLEAIPDIGQRAADDHAHGVIEIAAAHLVFNVDGNEVAAVAAAHSGKCRFAAGWGRRWTLRWKFLICQVGSYGGEINFYFSIR